MASIINALSSGTGGIVTAGDASGILQLQTSNTAAVTIDGSQNVGIGTASPGEKLSLGGAANMFMSLLTTGGIKTQIKAADANGYGGVGTVTNHAFAIETNNTERMRITNGGSLTINNSGAVLDTALLTVNCTAGTGSTIPLALRVGVDSDGYGCVIFKNQTGTQGAINVNTNNISMSGIGGLTFKATQVASADANTLDDYEEGTWTPDVVNNGKTSTWSVKNGYYRKIGGFVWVSGQVDTGASGATAGGALIIGGLPFNVVSAGSATWTFGTSWCSTQAANAQPIIFYGGASTGAQIWNTNIGSQDQSRLTTAVLFSFCYPSS
jgi:hypothetical protein